MMTFGEALRTARSRRDLSQQRLANIAGVANSTVARAEQGETDRMIAGNAARLIKALNQVAPLSNAELTDLTKSSGLTDALWAPDGPFYEHPPGLKPNPELAEFTHALRGLTRDQARVYNVLNDLRAFIDLNKLATALEAMRDALTPRAPTAAQPEPQPQPQHSPQHSSQHSPQHSPQHLALRSPPVQREGFVEETVRHIDVVPPPPAHAQPAHTQHRPKKASKRG